MGPMLSVFACFIMWSSSAASFGSGFVSSSRRKSCSFAYMYPDMRSPPIATPMAPTEQPWPCACHTACRMHLRTPSRSRPALPRCGSSAGSEYCMFLFSQPPPFSMSFTSMSSLSHCSQKIIGAPAPILSPLFLPVTESTVFGLNLPNRVASRMASSMSSFKDSWFTPGGVLILNVGMPVSWHIAPSFSQAMSMFFAMVASASAARDPGSSLSRIPPIAARTSEGRFVDVWIIRSSMLCRKFCMRDLGKMSDLFRTENASPMILVKRGKFNTSLTEAAGTRSIPLRYISGRMSVSRMILCSACEACLFFPLEKFPFFSPNNAHLLIRKINKIAPIMGQHIHMEAMQEGDHNRRPEHDLNAQETNGRADPRHDHSFSGKRGLDPGFRKYDSPS